MVFPIIFWITPSKVTLSREQLTENAKLNHLEDRVRFQCADVFELLSELEAKREKFNVVI